MPWPQSVFNFNGGAHVAIAYTLHGQQCINTLWFLHPGELGTPDWAEELRQLCLAIIECAVTHLLPGLSSQVTFTSVTATLHGAGAVQQHVEPFPANSVGALGESLPVQSAATVTFYSPFVGKSWRGGNRVAGVPEANHAQSILSGVPVAAILAFYACLLTKFKWDTRTENWAWVIFSRKHGFVSPSTYTLGEETTAPVVQTVVRDVVGSQNTRKLRRGI